MNNHIIYPRIVNASSANGESVQMVRGDADFYVLGNILREVCYDAIFISGVGKTTWTMVMDSGIASISSKKRWDKNPSFLLK